MTGTANATALTRARVDNASELYALARRFDRVIFNTTDGVITGRAAPAKHQSRANRRILGQVTNLDTSISESLRRMSRLAAALEASTENSVGAETWMQLEHAQLGNLLTRRASYNSRPDLDWSWMTMPTP